MFLRPRKALPRLEVLWKGFHASKSLKKTSMFYRSQKSFLDLEKVQKLFAKLEIFGSPSRNEGKDVWKVFYV